MKKKEDRYRPNHILGTLLIAASVLVLLLGQSLWIPASRIDNLHIRSFVLALADAGSSVASDLGLDTQVPAIRTAFLSVSGLSENTSWDTRYFNRRNASDSFEPATVSRTAGVTGPSSGQLPPAGNGLAATAAADSAAVPQSGSVPAGLPGVGMIQAAPVGVPAIVKAPANSTIHSAENPLSVYMFGDSQVFSLGSGLSRLAGKGSPIKVEFLAIHSSGFIRDDYFNWPAKLSDEFAANHYDAAVMMLGMNDYQSFRDAHGVILKKKTPEWEAAYKEKCRALIDIALASVSRVYWIGMPTVKNPVYNESLSYIDSVQAALASEYSPDVLVRIGLSDIIPGKGKSFVSSVDEGGGKTLQVMASDGSHFTVEGGERVMAPLFDRLAHDFIFAEVPVAQQPE